MLCFRKLLVAEKFLDKEGGERRDYRKFPSKNFCLKAPKIFVGKPLTLSIVSGIGKVYSSEGYVTICIRKLFV